MEGAVGRLPATATEFWIASPLQSEIIPPLEQPQLLWLFVMLTLLLLVARGLGELAEHFGLPSVVGELTAGIVLGPSLLGSIDLVTDLVSWTQGTTIEPQLHLVEVLAWIGLLMLIVLTGLETDLDLIVSEARTATYVSVASIVVPFVLGFAFAWYLPDRFIAEGGRRLVFSLFVATAMGISAIPVIAKILMDMGHIQRDFGQITLAAGMINDTVGWILLAIVAGLARTGQIELAGTAQTLLWLAAFLGIGFTLGLRAVKRLFIWIDENIGGQIAKITTLMVLALGVGSFTHALHLEAVLGAFVVGILVGQSNRFDYETEHTFEVLTVGVFAPIFFATAGLRVNLGTLLDPIVFVAAIGALGIAVIGKFAGTYVGAKAAGLSSWEGVTMGAGLNARGAMEIILAIVGLTLGVLTIEMYSIIVMIAIITSLMAPPMLRRVLPRLEMTDAERERIERAERMRTSFFANIQRVLLPTRGGPDTQYAAQLLGSLIRDTETSVTTLFVDESGREREDAWFGGVRRQFRGWFGDGGSTETHTANPDGGDPAGDTEDEDGDDTSERVFASIAEQMNLPEGRTPRTLVRESTGSVSETILEEAGEGYDLLALGEKGGHSDPDEPLYSEVVDRVVQETPIPVMAVATPYTDEDLPLEQKPLRRILLPTVGTQYNRHAAEIAFAIARNRDAVVEIVHVVNEPQLNDRFIEDPDLSQAISIGEEIVDREAEIGRQMGAEVLTTVTVGDRPEADIVDLASEDDADLVIMGSDMRPVSQRAFFGHRVEYVIQNAPCPVAVISSI